MKIGIIGAGHIGGTLTRRFAALVTMYSSPTHVDPSHLQIWLKKPAQLQ